jgi:hypothetical protein
MDDYKQILETLPHVMRVQVSCIALRKNISDEEALDYLMWKALEVYESITDLIQ